jgi:NAD(P)-dependent dehydrogenase (short-subunit alcohol dehydrogenase family)
MTLSFDRDHWALVLGGSSGIGLATAKKLARHGMSVAIVHRDRRGAMPGIEPAFAAIRETSELLTFNVDALSSSGRQSVLDALAERLSGNGKVRLLLHSIAFGNLKLLAPPPPERQEAPRRCREALASVLGIQEPALASSVQELFGSPVGDALSRLAEPACHGEGLLGEEDFERTISAMGTSLATWALDLFERGLFASSARVIGLTSEGNELALRGYAAVAAAKAAMESIVRAIALELAPYGVRANIVQPGVTDTPALALIPEHRHMKASARQRNPFGRLTTPEDVADFIALLCTDEAAWVNGALLRVDGGERIGA